MRRRFVSIWFPHLVTDWFTICDPSLAQKPFVVCTVSRGQMIILSASPAARLYGIRDGMVLADARAILPSLTVLNEKHGLREQLLKRLALWCIRFTPIAASDLPDGLLLDATGCSHLWGGEKAYMNEVVRRLKERGYHVHAAMASTIGAAWGLARFEKEALITQGEEQTQALLFLPASALRLEAETLERLQKLGLHRVRDFMNMPRPALRRRFGQQLLRRIDQALGRQEEMLEPVHPVEPYQERLCCLDPITTLKGIEIALHQLLETLCCRLRSEQKGLRLAVFKGYQVDGGLTQIMIETSGPSSHAAHLFRLFEIRFSSFEPGSGIELFVLEAKKTEPHAPEQEKIWESPGLKDSRLAELLDRLAARLGTQSIRRYLAAEHYLPERSFRPAASLDERSTVEWKTERPRPMQLLPRPEPIEVTAPIPDYPPMLFRYKGKLHKISKADGPERIEQEWWLKDGVHRDYYYVEDEEGQRYWLFRSGHYDADKTYGWFIHGFFS